MSLALPCEHCGAEAEVPCADDCPSFAALDHQESRFEQARGKLMESVYQLPFGRLAGEPPDRKLMPTQQWLIELADYMETYTIIAHSMVDKLESDSRRAMSLQFEKDVVRGYFMLDRPGGSA